MGSARSLERGAAGRGATALAKQASPRRARHREESYLNGKIVRLVRDRGFGFIQVGGGKEVFFHHTAVQDGVFDSMSEGGSVEFDMGQDSNSSRERAINVRVVVV